MPSIGIKDNAIRLPELAGNRLDSLPSGRDTRPILRQVGVLSESAAHGTQRDAIDVAHQEQCPNVPSEADADTVGVCDEARTGYFVDAKDEDGDSESLANEFGK